jgi:hypothetical protein
VDGHDEEAELHKISPGGSRVNMGAYSLQAPHRGGRKPMPGTRPGIRISKYRSSDKRAPCGLTAAGA